MATTLDILKSLYNSILIKKNYWYGYVINPMNGLTQKVAEGKVEAYQDVADMVYAMILQSVPEVP